MTKLSEVIIEKIKGEGPVSFHDFMEMCLYHPELGYYNSSRERIGTNGDYYTSSVLHPLYGIMMGKQLEEMWKLLGGKELTIVEYGAGTGELCRNIMEYLKNNKPLYDHLQYCIIEKSRSMREREKLLLHDQVTWLDSISELTNFQGCIISNEVVDNFSVHEVVMQEELMEVFVDYKNGFTELLLPASSSLKNYLGELNIQLPKGFRTEVNLQAITWIEEIAVSLSRGYVITIDYGYPSNEFYRSCRSNGTLMCYQQHAVNDRIYDDIGMKDITSHVNFSALMHWGEKNRLRTCGLTNQAHFLLGLGLGDHLSISENHIPDYLNNAFLKYTLLVDMGSKFKVLIQRKGVENCPLKGLKYVRSLGIAA